MTHVVLDACAVFALLLDEPGAAEVKAELDEATLGAANLAEIVRRYAKLGAARPVRGRARCDLVSRTS